MQRKCRGNAEERPLRSKAMVGVDRLLSREFFSKMFVNHGLSLDLSLRLYITIVPDLECLGCKEPPRQTRTPQPVGRDRLASAKVAPLHPKQKYARNPVQGYSECWQEKIGMKKVDFQAQFQTSSAPRWKSHGNGTSTYNNRVAPDTYHLARI